MRGLAVQFDADPVLLQEVVQVDAAPAPGDTCLATSAGQPMGPLDVADVAYFQHRVCTAMAVAEGFPQAVAPAQLGSQVHGSKQPARRREPGSARLAEPAKGNVEGRGGLGQVQDGLLDPGPRGHASGMPCLIQPQRSVYAQARN